MADELVDQILNQSGVGESSGGPGVSTDPNQSADGAGRDRTADGRIKSLVREKNQYKESYSQVLSEAQNMKSELAELRGMVQGMGRQNEPEKKHVTSYSDFSDDQLMDLIAQSGENGNHAAMALAINELTDRKATNKASAIVDEKVGEFGATQKASEFSQRVQGETFALVGEDAMNVESPLYERANQHFAHIKRDYSDDEIAQFPHLQQLAYLRAKNDLNTGLMDRLTQANQELARLRALTDVETGASEGAASNSGVQEALTRKPAQGGPDIKGAIKALNMFRRS